MTPVIEINQLTFTYQGEQNAALSQVDLRLYPGEFMTITGPSGCGKSTLAMCLAGFIPTAFPGEMMGEVLIQGHDTRQYPEGGLSGIVGLVQQDPEGQLCTLTVADEVAFGPENLCVPPEEIRSRVITSLEAVDGMHLFHRQVHTLSGGEKQRVAIASVLAMEPALLILDEPTANLDPRCTREVLQVLAKLQRKKAVSLVIIEHRLEQVLPWTDRLIRMDQGRIVSRIDRAEILQGGLKAASQTSYVPEAFESCDKSRYSMANDKEASVAEQVLLSVEHLQAGYEDRMVLSDVSFQLLSGETVALMGDNGSGKTTLILSLLGIIKPSGGKIWFQQEAMTGKKVAYRARHMGLVFQNPHHQLFENSVWREALLPASFLSENSPDTVEEITGNLLEDFHLNHYREKNPFTLSLGEKKRLALVSVLAYGPSLLILDEPLVGQDRERMLTLMNALQYHRRQGGSVLMVCHEPAVVATFCQRILFVKDGSIVIDAPTAEAFQMLKAQGHHEYLPACGPVQIGEEGGD